MPTAEPSERRSRPTIRDVARLAGVGIKTVSRVTNGERDVSAATAAKVAAAMAQLQWEPDAWAANLRRSKTRTRSLGLLLGSVSNPFAATIHRAIEDAAAEHGTAVLAASLDEDPLREIAAVEAFVRRKVDGLAMTCASPSQEYLSTALPDGLPLVFIDRPAADFPGHSVVSDNRGGAVLGTRHLIERGHRRIAFLGDRTEIWTARERHAGFDAARESAGLSTDPTLIATGLRTQDEAQHALAHMLDQPDPPTAVFAAQNLITVGAVRALRVAGRQRQIALVGFDDIELGDLLEPGVTVIAQRPAEIGARAAARLFAALEADAQISPDREVVPVDLVARGSGEIVSPSR